MIWAGHRAYRALLCRSFDLKLLELCTSLGLKHLSSISLCWWHWVCFLVCVCVVWVLLLWLVFVCGFLGCLVSEFVWVEFECLEFSWVLLLLLFRYKNKACCNFSVPQSISAHFRPTQVLPSIFVAILSPSFYVLIYIKCSCAPLRQPNNL